MTQIVRLLALAALFALAGCASFGMRQSKVKLPSGEEYVVNCQLDGQVHFKNKDVDISVDNRGRPGMLEQALSATLLGSAGITNTAANLLKETK